MYGKIKKFIYKRMIGIFITPEKYAKLIGVTIGDNNFINDKNHWSSEPYLIKIGSNCAITQGVRIFTHGGSRVARKKYPDYDFFGKVNIGNWVYIGTNSLIMPGVNIGDGSLIAAGSVVTKSIPSGVVVGGNPAKIISTVDEFIKHTEKYNLNTKKMSYEEKKLLLCSLPEDRFIIKREMNN